MSKPFFRTAAFLLSGALSAIAAAPAAAADPVDHVDPFVGTARMGHTYPGATVPFGMVQLSPDTRRVKMYDESGRYTGEAYPYCAGYQYADSTIVGFSHTHFSGTGHSDLGDILVLPVAGAGVDLRDPPVATFTHAAETASPGRYDVRLRGPAGGPVDASLAATTRVGLHRYAFTPGDTMSLLVDLAANIYDYDGKNVWTFVRVENDTLVTGWRQVTGWARTRTVYFAMAFDRPVRAYGHVRLDDTPYTGFYRRFDQENDFPEFAGRDIRARFRFGVAEAGDPLHVKVAISGVSTAGAVANMAAEAPGWDFAGAREAARRAWSDEFSRYGVEMLDDARRDVFYTALYHTMLGPVVFEDVDGTYRGLDQNVHRSDGFTNHTVFSLWDTYRALHPWFTITRPARNADMIASMLAHYDQSVHPMLPVWSHWANENWCMIGYHAVPVIADALVKGTAPGIDPERALAACATTASVPYFDGVGELPRLGYIPEEASSSSVSVTLEIAHDDWCVARLAELAGDPDTAARFDARSRSFENLYDPRIGFMRPRNRAGEWRADFDVMATHGQGFIEGNAWTYSLSVPHDVPRLVALMGGPAAFGARLDSLFTMELDDAHIAHTEDITRDGIIGNYVHGNEPGHHVAYLYNWSDRPWRTQERVRDILATMYGNGPDGLCGNDDAGQMSAWYLFSALGFYPVCPGSDRYDLGSPEVVSARIELENGNVLEVRTVDQAPDHPYVRRVLLDGAPLDRRWVTHAELTGGHVLTFEMGAEPVR